MRDSASIADVTKDRMLRVRVDDRDRARLERLADHHEMPEAAVIRLLIKQAADALPEPAAPEIEKAPKKRR